MRQAGTLPSETAARRFSDYLLTLGIVAHIDEDADGWAVWIRDENHLDEAKQQLRDFQYDPEHTRYREAPGRAASLRRQAQQQAEQARKNIVDVRGRWDRGSARRAPVTFTVIALCVAVFILTGFGNFSPPNDVMRGLQFVDPGPPDAQNRIVKIDRWQRLANIQQGEIWRLISPNYVHLGIWHLVFNMYWLYRFGAEIESHRGSLYLILMLVVIGLLSNVAQAMIESPYGGGMSGVVYGLFGYIWMKSAYDPGSGFQIQNFTVVVLVIWFFLCLSMDDIANTAHGAGLALGVVWGYAPVLWRSLSKGP